MSVKKTGKFILGFLFFFSLASQLLWEKYYRAGKPKGLRSQVYPPRRVSALMMWGMGFVGVTVLVIMVLSFVCVGSPGETPGIVPN